MVTEIQKSKLAGLLSNIKSKDGKNNLLDHINKMYIIKNKVLRFLLNRLNDTGVSF